ncbi:MAG: WYL domain-containing protein [Betaproteobacteria bacterium]|nr:MAG: WYL domain-containing protein [Betaproteobacteria bacterium]
MDRTERFYKIERMLRESRVVPFAAMRARLEVSPATLKRDLEYMRSRLHAPIEFDRAAGGYRLAESDPAASRHELPGLWFSPAEIHALLTLQHLVAHLRTGSLVGPHLEALASRLTAALGSAAGSVQEVRRRVRILDIAARDIALEHFELVGSALLRRRRLHIGYFARGRGESTEREISPQRLVHYRDNWYLDAYCHVRDDLRSFSVDAIRSAAMLDAAAIDLPDDELDARLGSGYGIFSGKDVAWARLRFTPERARWVAAEQWHPRQRTQFEPDGSFILELPYSDPRELVMDVLRHGAEVEVLDPDRLRDEVRRTVESMHARYQACAAR